MYDLEKKELILESDFFGVPLGFNNDSQPTELAAIEEVARHKYRHVLRLAFRQSGDSWLEARIRVSEVAAIAPEKFTCRALDLARYLGHITTNADKKTVKEIERIIKKDPSGILDKAENWAQLENMQSPLTNPLPEQPTAVDMGYTKEQ